MEFTSVVPILRIFDQAKAKEFYEGFLGFSIDWTHVFEEGLPLYLQISRGSLVIHLSEHHGDGSPGIRIRVNMKGIEELHRELEAKKYKFMRPGLEETDHGTRELTVIDPFGNTIIFSERLD